MALAFDAPKRLRGALRIGDAQGGAVVVAELKFREIAIPRKRVGHFSVVTINRHLDHRDRRALSGLHHSGNRNVFSCGHEWSPWLVLTGADVAARPICR